MSLQSTDFLLTYALLNLQQQLTTYNLISHTANNTIPKHISLRLNRSRSDAIIVCNMLVSTGLLNCELSLELMDKQSYYNYQVHSKFITSA